MPAPTSTGGSPSSSRLEAESCEATGEGRSVAQSAITRHGRYMQTRSSQDLPMDTASPPLIAQVRIPMWTQAPFTRGHSLCPATQPAPRMAEIRKLGKVKMECDDQVQRNPHMCSDVAGHL